VSDALRFHGLVAGYLDGDLDDAQRRDLHAIVSADPVAARALLDEIALHESLCLVQRGERGRRSALCEAVLAAWRTAAPTVPRRSIAWVRLAMASAAALVIAGVIALLAAHRSGDDLPTLAAVSGTMALERDGAPTAWAIGDALRPDDRVRLSDGEVALAYDDGTSVRIVGAADLRLAPARAGKALHLAAGRIVAEATAQPTDRPLTVATPHARAVVRGTRFAIAVASTTDLSVVEGRVQLVGVDGAVADVAAGHFAVAGLPGPPVARRRIVIAIEAESASLAAPMAVVTDRSAGGGAAIASPVVDAGSATVRLAAPIPDGYVLWCRVRADDADRDSFLVAVDGGADEIFDVAERRWSPGWQWTRLCRRTGRLDPPGSPHPETEIRDLVLAAGDHAIVFAGREAGTALDAVVLTNDPGYRPDD